MTGMARLDLYRASSILLYDVEILYWGLILRYQLSGNILIYIEVRARHQLQERALDCKLTTIENPHYFLVHTLTLIPTAPLFVLRSLSLLLASNQPQTPLQFPEKSPPHNPLIPFNHQDEKEDPYPDGM